VDPHAAGAAAQPEERTEMQVSVDEAVSAQPAVESVMAAAAAASTAVSTPDPAAAPQAPAASPPGGIDINSATAAELAAGLNGVGASRAEAIVRYREQFGPFESIEELVEVGGIGPATVERNRALLRLR
jgi:competence protein ComEA